MLSIARSSLVLVALCCIWLASAQDAVPAVTLVYFNDSTCATNTSIRGSVVYLDRPCDNGACTQIGTTQWYSINICPTPPFAARPGWLSVWQYSDNQCSAGNITRILTAPPTSCFAVPGDTVTYAKMQCDGEQVTANICSTDCDTDCQTFEYLNENDCTSLADTGLFATGFGCKATPQATPQTTPQTTTPPVAAPVATPTFVPSSPNPANAVAVSLLVLASAVVFSF